MRVPNAYEEGCCHAPSHIPGRKPLQTSRPDRWTRASLVNRSGRRNSFGHLVDGFRLRLRGIVDPLADGTAATPRHRASRGGRARKKKLSRPRMRACGAFDHKNRKTPISKPAANAQRPNVQAEITRTRLRRSCGISWD